jgi:hypothetical protein
LDFDLWISLGREQTPPLQGEVGLPNALKGDVYDTTGGKDVKKILIGSRTALRFIQVFSGKTKVSQNSCKSAFGNILVATMRNGSERFILGVPPDLVRTWSLTNKLTAQPAELLGQYAISHTGTRRSV